jgi:tensin
MPRSRSADIVGARSHDNDEESAADKLRPITPVTYTNLVDWRRGHREVYVINDVTLPADATDVGRGLGAPNPPTAVSGFDEDDDVDDDAQQQQQRRRLIRRSRPKVYVENGNDVTVTSTAGEHRNSEAKGDDDVKVVNNNDNRRHRTGSNKSSSSSSSPSKHQRHRRHHRKHSGGALNVGDLTQVAAPSCSAGILAVDRSTASGVGDESSSSLSRSAAGQKNAAGELTAAVDSTSGDRRRNNHVTFPTTAARHPEARDVTADDDDVKMAAGPPPFRPVHLQLPSSSTAATNHQFARTPSPLSDALPKLQPTPRFVHDSSKYWHKPRISRDEAINYLKNRPPGSFVIRNSNSFPGAFGLALRVAKLPPNVRPKGNDPQADLVRHFLIEPTPNGVRLKGCSTEPVFGSLAALVYQHSLTPLFLPCKLIIPEPPTDRTDGESDDGGCPDVDVISTAQQILNQGAACSVVYVTSMDTECLTGPDAVRKSVDFALAVDPAPKTTVVHFKVSSLGITLTDLRHRLFFRRHYPIDTVTFCGLDPDDRRWTWVDESSQLPCSAKMFGFVAKRLGGSKSDNACHVFAEVDPDQPAEAIVNFVMKVMIGRGQKTS